MRIVELCFHERDARAEALASRGLSEAGVVVLRRPISGGRFLTPQAADARRVLLHTPTIAALPDDHPARAEFAQPMVVAPVEGPWPLRSSRPWLYAAARSGQALERRQLESAGFWKLVAWATALPTIDRAARIGAQTEIFRALDALKPSAPVQRRHRSIGERLGFRPLEAISGARDWERAVTPLAVAGTLVATAIVSALVVDVATRPEAWGAIAQDDATRDATTNAFTN